MGTTRIYHMLILFGIMLVLLIIRLAQIQLFDTLSFSKHQINLLEESVDQRIHSIALDDGRGKLYDRHGNLLRRVHEPAIIIFPFLRGQPLHTLASLLNMSSAQLERQLTNRTKPLVLTSAQITSETLEEVNQLQLPGVYGQMLDQKHSPDFASHFVGVLRENPEGVKERYSERLEKGLIDKTTLIGISGLQQAFDPFLISEGESKLIYHVEQSGRPLFGLDVKYGAPSNPFYPVALQTTLDPKMQFILEKAIDRYDVSKGGAVLLDVETSDVLAMVSRPVAPDSDPLKKGTENHMLTPKFPGSVFKIVTAAAAIEENRIAKDRAFNCNQNVYNDGPDSRKLGFLSFEESFYQSCNLTFATVLNEMMVKNENVIVEYSEKLGLTSLAGWQGDVFHLNAFRHFPNEKKNIIWEGEKHNHVPRAIAQTAIGQLNVRLSPLSVANMMATIARGGSKKQVRAAHSVEYKNDATLVAFEEKNQSGATLSRYTVKKLQDLLEGVVRTPKGTGHASFHELPWRVAGKSGTAEKGELANYNKWFAGYFPTDHPKYVLVVVDLKANSKTSTTNATFAEIVQELYKLQQQPGSK